MKNESVGLEQRIAGADMVLEKCVGSVGSERIDCVKSLMVMEQREGFGDSRNRI